ncbi:LETM1-like protein [Tanacetum coccineum]
MLHISSTFLKNWRIYTMQFYVSNLRKCLSDAVKKISYQDVQVNEKLTYVKELVAIFDHLEKLQIIPGPAGIVQTVKLRKQADIQEGGEESIMSTQEYIRKVVEITRFWKDHWIGDAPLYDLFPRLFSLEMSGDVTVVQIQVICLSDSFRRRGGIEDCSLRIPELSVRKCENMAEKGLMKQDLSKLDVAKLHLLSPEVISSQATMNIGTIGHVAHGKSTIIKAFCGVQIFESKGFIRVGHIFPFATADDGLIVNANPQASTSEDLRVKQNQPLKHEDYKIALVQSLRDVARVFELAFRGQSSGSNLSWFSFFWLGVDQNACLQPLSYQVQDGFCVFHSNRQAQEMFYCRFMVAYE